ncbi:MAG TPA: sigma-70 family RNA polymerase sigma factor [Steroidobacteraceae bacterium]|nr:sigma-70 family RNA polymerase sigma factor [Steroidobacteraceae bacterium]
MPVTNRCRRANTSNSRGNVEQAERELQWAGWMRAATAGDEGAYRRLLDSLAGHLRRMVRHRLARIGHGDLEVEDIVQETLLAIHLKRHTWRPSEPVSPWVAAISRNKTIDVLRRRGRRAELPLDDTEESELLIVDAEAEGVNQDLERVLGSLDERSRRIVQLVSIEGHSSRTAAERVGISEGALRVALHRSLKMLAVRWRNENQ